jgi:hypothetical protein
MPAAPFADALANELDRRRRANPRFSLRGFARVIGLSHSAVSRLIRATQRPSPASITRAGGRLGWSETMVASLIRRERVTRLEVAAASPRFVADARWIAAQANLTLDEVQVALHEALRTRRLTMPASHTWKVSR